MIDSKELDALLRVSRQAIHERGAGRVECLAQVTRLIQSSRVARDTRALRALATIGSLLVASLKLFPQSLA
jgi:hypothetical protein